MLNTGQLVLVSSQDSITKYYTNRR